MENFEEWSSKRGNRLVALATRRAASFYRVLGMRNPRRISESCFEPVARHSFELSDHVAGAS